MAYPQFNTSSHQSQASSLHWQWVIYHSFTHLTAFHLCISSPWHFEMPWEPLQTQKSSYSMNLIQRQQNSARGKGTGMKELHPIREIQLQVLWALEGGKHAAKQAVNVERPLSSCTWSAPPTLLSWTVSRDFSSGVIPPNLKWLFFFFLHQTQFPCY